VQTLLFLHLWAGKRDLGSTPLLKIYFPSLSIAQAMSEIENAGRKGYCMLYFFIFFFLFLAMLIYLYMGNNNGVPPVQ
jgi:hypothetical protein